MTEIDTSADAIERLAETLLFRGHHHQEKINHLLRRLHVERITAAKTLRALAAERADLRATALAIQAERDSAAKARDEALAKHAEVFAERDRLLTGFGEFRERAGEISAALLELRETKAECDRLREENRRLREEVRTLTTCGIVEVSVRNPSVLDYMRHWEGRAEAAEAALTEARAETGALIERDPARILKDAIFAILKIGTAPVTYGGVLVEPSRWARIRFDTYGEDEHAALAEVRRAAKAEGMKEAADVCIGETLIVAPESVGQRAALTSYRAQFRSAILALAAEIEKGATS